MVAIRHIWNQHILGSMRHLEAAQRSHTSCEMNACSSYDISCQGQRLKSLIWHIILTLTWGNHLRYCFVVSEKELDLSSGQWNELISTTWGNIWDVMSNCKSSDWESPFSSTYTHDLKPLKTGFQSIYLMLLINVTFKVKIQTKASLDIID